MAETKKNGGDESKTAIVAAVVGNLLIAVTKFTAAAFTGSSAMISEGIHSVVDMGNGGLMLWGLHKSKEPPDREHPFGHGRELYFWTLIVALSIFAVGGGVSIYEGVKRIQHPVEIEKPIWNYLVLGLSAVFESITWYYGWKAFRKEKKGKTILQGIKLSKDPTSFTVFLEDSAALTGLLIAFLGVFFGHYFGFPFFDGLASILIGSLLCLVALLLGYETKGLLIGEAVEKEKLQEIRKIAAGDPHVEKVLNALTLYFGPRDVLLTLELDFVDNITAKELRTTVRNIERNICREYPEITRVYYEAESLSEKELQEQSDK